MNKITINGSMSPDKKLCWSSIIAGCIVAIALGNLINILGASVGLSILNFDSEDLAQLGSVAFIWLAISGVVSLGAGSWLASYLANVYSPISGIWYGLLVWSVAMLLGLAVVSTGVGIVISGGASFLGKAISSSSNKETRAGHLFNNLAVTESGVNTEAQVNKTEVKEKAEHAAEQLSKAALLSFITLLLGVVASMTGGYFGAREHR